VVCPYLVLQLLSGHYSHVVCSYLVLQLVFGHYSHVVCSYLILQSIRGQSHSLTHILALFSFCMPLSHFVSCVWTLSLIYLSS
jgi:hypothetical protein